MGNKIEGKFGINSLLYLVLGVLFFILFLMISGTNERVFFFYGGFILFVLSFVLGLIGIIKDTKKLLSIISVFILLLFIFGVFYYYIFVLPKEIEGVINNWQSVWGIRSH